MVIYGVGSLLLAVAMLALALQRLYSSVPARELKRLAGRGDHLAKRLYRVAAYGASLRILLWAMLGISLSGGFLLLIPELPRVAGFAILVLTSAMMFVWLPSMPLTVRSAQFASWFVAPLAWVLSRMHPFFDRVADLLDRYRNLEPHSRLYEKDDVRQVLGMQKDQPDNRIDVEDIVLLERALDFGDRQAADIVQPRAEAHLVSADETIGPILLDQLHKSGQNSFLVYKDSPENILGSLSMHDAVKAKQGGRVFDLVRSDLTFVHEDFSLRDVLTAFQKTGHHVAVVINSFEEFIGLISFDRLIAELLGDTSEQPPISYSERHAVAAFQKAESKQAKPTTDSVVAEESA